MFGCISYSIYYYNIIELYHTATADIRFNYVERLNNILYCTTYNVQPSYSKRYRILQLKCGKLYRFFVRSINMPIQI